MATSRRLGLVMALAGALAVLSCTDQPPTAPDIAAAKGGNGGGGGGGGGKGPKVDAADPNNSPQDTTLDVRVIGSGFDQGSVARWLLNGEATPKIVTNNTQFVSSTELIANITIALDADTVLYDIEVRSSRGKKGIGTELFKVREKGGKEEPLFAVTVEDGVIGAATVPLRTDSKSLLEVSQPVFPIDTVVMPNTYALAAPLLDGGDPTQPWTLDPMCRFGLDYEELNPKQQREQRALLIGNVARGPSSGNILIQINKDALGTVGGHYFRLRRGEGDDPDIRRFEITGMPALNRRLAVTFLGHGDGDPSPDVDDATRPRIFELTGGILRFQNSLGPKVRDPDVDLRCTVVDTIRVTIAPVE